MGMLMHLFWHTRTCCYPFWVCGDYHFQSLALVSQCHFVYQAQGGAGILEFALTFFVSMDAGRLPFDWRSDDLVSTCFDRSIDFFMKATKSGFGA